jgi:2-polyprenyl-6-methoxyphenol hydroxylase-like FAD-dependent oxidoreductase
MGMVTNSATMQVGCCIVGGGPAGVMLGLLLARAGVETVVLEKHGDFLRDFRGDTVHPSTLQVMHELGFLDDFLARPHQETSQITGYVGDEPVVVADFSHLPTRCRFVAFMPQWHFLDFLTEKARQYPSFHLKMQAKGFDLLEEAGLIVGVKVETPEGNVDVRATLVVGADGRHSIIRERAGLQVQNVGAPMDVLWMRLSRKPDDPSQAAGRFDQGRIFVMIDRGDNWQCAFVIPKGAFENIQRQGIEAFRTDIVAIAPFLNDRVGEIQNWDQVKLLTVVVDHLKKWHRPGLLCIGDAAHAMSPVGGVGINLAIQDAVAAANILVGPLKKGQVTAGDLARVQRRREMPTWLTQRIQVFVQNRVIRRVLASHKKLKMPLALRLFRAFPFLRRIPARLIGMGFRPEHIKRRG